MRRRSFLQTAPAWLGLPVLAANANPLATTSDFVRPGRHLKSKKKRVALIGCGWYGKNDLMRLLQVADVDVVGICDVDAKMLEETERWLKERRPEARPPRTYLEYRAMILRELPDIILIATPDHQHARMAIHAMKAGADLYLQKPISVDVMEGEAILATARQLGRKVQIGTQRRSTPHLLDMKKKILDSGLIGKIGHVEMCCYYHMRSRDNPAVVPVPDHFDYQRWTGPAPLIPFTGLPHRRWRSRQEYGNGIVGDMCVHMFDTARWLLNLGWPEKITSTGGIRLKNETWANTSDTQSAVFSYPQLDCVWQHRTWGPPTDPDYPWALFLYGENGTLKMDTKKWDYIPNDVRRTNKVAGSSESANVAQSGEVLYEHDRYPEDLSEPEIELHVASATRAHLRELVDAIETDRLPNADVEQGHISTASCILANLSRDLGGRPLTYDPVRRVVIDDPEATALLQRPYREGFVHPWESFTKGEH